MNIIEINEKLKGFEDYKIKFLNNIIQINDTRNIYCGDDRSMVVSYHAPKYDTINFCHTVGEFLNFINKSIGKKFRKWSNNDEQKITSDTIVYFANSGVKSNLVITDVEIKKNNIINIIIGELNNESI